MQEATVAGTVYINRRTGQLGTFDGTPRRGFVRLNKNITTKTSINGVLYWVKATPRGWTVGDRVKKADIPAATNMSPEPDTGNLNPMARALIQDMGKRAPALMNIMRVLTIPVATAGAPVVAATTTPLTLINGAGSTLVTGTIIHGTATPACGTGSGGSPGGGPCGGSTFPNTLPERLQGDLDTASRLGVTPLRVGDPGFDATINGGTVKWAVTENGELVIVPKFVGDTEISHSVLTGGQPVQTAGEAEIVGNEGNYFLIDVNNHSGHFIPSQESVDTIGIDTFNRNGIRTKP